MKKYLIAISLVLVALLSSCQQTGTTPEFTITLSANIESATPTSVLGDVIKDKQSYEIIAPQIEGYEFSNWRELNTTTVVSFEPNFTYIPTADISLEAIYEALESDVTVYTITVTSNITATIISNGTLTTNGSTQYELVAPNISNYTFTNWIDIDDSSMLSSSQTYVFVATKNINIQAVYEATVIGVIENFTVTVSANITTTISSSNTLKTNGSTQYELLAPEVDGYTFINWIDTTDSSILSFTQTYMFVATKNIDIQAVYETTTAAGEPTLFYETSFEDGSKGSYAQAPLRLSSENWIFSDALIGSLATDKMVAGNSVRIRDGYIETQFKVGQLAQVFFWIATYGGDDNSIVNFQISVDKLDWVTVESFTTTNVIIEHNIIFDEALFSSLSLSSDNAYYIRIASPSPSRTNIDDLQIYTGEGQLIDDTPLYTITFTDDMVYSYLLNDPIDLTDCVATHSINGATTCNTIGTVDNTTPGIYEITFYKTDQAGNTAIEIVRITIIDGDTSNYLTMDLSSYYDNAEGLYGEDLVDSLNIIINNGFNGVTYGDVRYILDETDEDPNNPSNVILVYQGTSVSENWVPTTFWNREHVWPQSLLGEKADNGTVNSASDLYNLMPSNPGENSSRSNSPYSEMGLGYEPRDEVKGDVARALFYMMIKYDYLDLVDTAPGLHEMGYISELLQWHLDDPVDDFELNRLEVIYSYQSNRNPFVDYPHLVNLIWFYEE